MIIGCLVCSESYQAGERHDCKRDVTPEQVQAAIGDAIRVDPRASQWNITYAKVDPHPGVPVEQAYAKLSADHAHLKAWNEELVVLLRAIGLDVAWAQKDELRGKIRDWTYQQTPVPRCLAALEEKLASTGRLLADQEIQIAKLNAELETCRRRLQA